MKGSGDFSIGSTVWPGTSKLIEEMGELHQVLGKLIATAGDTDHWSGDLRMKLVEEIGDVCAAIRFFGRNMTPLENSLITRRTAEKTQLFEKWHSDQQSGKKPDQKRWETTETTEEPVGAWRKCQLRFRLPMDAAVTGHELNASEGASILSGSMLESIHPVLRADQTYLIRVANGNTEQRVGLTLTLLETPK